MIELQYDAVLKETDNAWLIEFEPSVEVWIPKSQCGEPDGTIEIKEWLVTEKELDEYIV